MKFHLLAAILFLTLVVLVSYSNGNRFVDSKSDENSIEENMSLFEDSNQDSKASSSEELTISTKNTAVQGLKDLKMNFNINLEKKTNNN